MQYRPIDPGLRHHILRKTGSAKVITFLDVWDFGFELVEIAHHRNPDRHTVFYYE